MDPEPASSHMHSRGAKRMKLEHQDDESVEQEESPSEEMPRLLREIHSAICR